MVGDGARGRLAGKWLVLKAHARFRMAQRGISVDAVYLAADMGEVIEAYPDDTPHPSELILGWVGEMPLHIVLAYNEPADEFIVVTAYYPDRDLWQSNFRERR